MVYQGLTSDCNHYLAFAAILYAGLFGIKNNIKMDIKGNSITEYSNDDLSEEVKNNKYFSEKFGNEITNEVIKRLGGKV